MILGNILDQKNDIQLYLLWPREKAHRAQLMGMATITNECTEVQNPHHLNVIYICGH